MNNQHAIVVLAYNVRSLWNVGSIFRSSDAMGVSKLYLTGYTGRPPRREIAKTALGAEEAVPWEHCEEPLHVIENLRKQGFQIVSLEQTERSIPLSDFTPRFPLCLILGHELNGVRPDLLEKSDAIVEIPMYGRKESLNVAVAAGIALHSIRETARGARGETRGKKWLCPLRSLLH